MPASLKLGVEFLRGVFIEPVGDHKMAAVVIDPIFRPPAKREAFLDTNPLDGCEGEC